MVSGGRSNIRRRFSKALAVALLAVMFSASFVAAPADAHTRRSNYSYTTTVVTTEYQVVLNVGQRCTYYQRRQNRRTTVTTFSRFHPHNVLSRASFGALTPWVTYQTACRG